MMVALLSDLSAEVIFLPRSANTMMTSELNLKHTQHQVNINKHYVN